MINFWLGVIAATVFFVLLVVVTMIARAAESLPDEKKEERVDGPADASKHLGYCAFCGGIIQANSTIASVDYLEDSLGRRFHPTGSCKDYMKEPTATPRYNVLCSYCGYRVGDKEGEKIKYVDGKALHEKCVESFVQQQKEEKEKNATSE